MMNIIRHPNRILGLMLVLVLMFSGCKSKKKAMEAAAAEKARMEQEARLKQQQEEEARRKAEEEKAKANADAESKERARYTILGQYFDAIAGAGNTAAANSSINEALTMFASPDTPVLIVISQTGDQKDYDRPTTIRDYLNYLKDQKKNINKIGKLQFNDAGKITEVELRKEY